MGAKEVGDDLLSRVAVSSAARASLLSSGWDQVFPRTCDHRQIGTPPQSDVPRVCRQTMNIKIELEASGMIAHPELRIEVRLDRARYPKASEPGRTDQAVDR